MNSNVDVNTQIDYFVSECHRRQALDLGDFLPMLDVEDVPSYPMHWNWTNVNSMIPDAIRRLRAQSGINKVAIYASLNTLQTLFDFSKYDSEVYWWVAYWNGNPGTVPWNHPLAIHQHTSDGNVHGIPGRVDRDVIMDDYLLSDLLIGDNDMAYNSIAEAVWDYKLDSGHENNPKWHAHSFLTNNEKDIDQSQTILRQIASTLNKVAKQNNVDIDVDEQAIASQILTKLNAESIATLLNESLAHDTATEVVNILTDRLTK